ncbi:class I SAM-dependent methyltransferase [Crocinitomicaceae bacterium CZZ-1]|uniref:Class I SAM-dependent methyltransferase n=1 Tax=Taishania pollutisoli TaxID=2766479 RepID=A0A8J6PG29_9FLAO|nr:class I SAM-dependent methyltransferase [Taishania pollutisoli]MBC9813723.1 class I SAM-dependent methyltransferase [Taishania pollutisoli]
MEEQDLKALSEQLMKPSGERGIEVANMMNENNIGMTVNSIENLELKGNERILEIGHGNAGHLDYLLKKAEKLQYEGIDISELMIQEAVRINKAPIANKQAVFTLYDGTTIPFEQESFDAVFTVNTIYFWSDPAAFMNEIARVLKKGGRFALTFAEASFMEQLPFTKFNFTLYNLEAVQQLVDQAGLTIEKTDLQKEHIRSKTGEMVEREFVTVVIKK